MKKVRFILSVILALALLLATPLSALAATWDAETSDDVVNAFVSDTDAEVVINMKNDINMDTSVTANEGQNYTINGNGNVISDVSLNGSGTVEINADVTGVDNYAALAVWDDVTVTVNGDVSGHDVTEEEDWSAAGLEAGGSAKVTVNGDVTGGSGMQTEEVMEDPMGYSDGSVALSAYDNAEVTVTGDVTGGDAYGTYAWAGDGMYVKDEAQVTVGGDVTGGNVTADPEVEVYTETWEAENGETETFIANSVAGAAIVAESTATVTVGGDVTGGSTNGDAGEGGNGIILKVADSQYDEEGNKIELEGAVTVDGTVTGGAGGENGEDAAAVYFDTYYDLDLAAALEADPEDILAEILEAEENEDYEALYNSGYMALEMAFELMKENGDLTEEELEAFYEQFADMDGTPEEAMLEFLTAVQKLIKENASSDNLLGLMADNFADLTVGDVSDANGGAFDSNLGKAVAEDYAQEHVVVLNPKGGSSDNGNPTTGDNSGIMVVAAVMVVSMLGICALIVQRKRAV